MLSARRECPHRATAASALVSLESAMAAAEARCLSVGERWTASRRRTYELLVADSRPSKAYDLIARFKDHDATTKPPTVYRSLDFLMGLGLDPSDREPECLCRLRSSRTLTLPEIPDLRLLRSCGRVFRRVRIDHTVCGSWLVRSASHDCRGSRNLRSMPRGLIGRAERSASWALWHPLGPYVPTEWLVISGDVPVLMPDPSTN